MLLWVDVAMSLGIISFISSRPASSTLPLMTESYCHMYGHAILPVTSEKCICRGFAKLHFADLCKNHTQQVSALKRKQVEAWAGTTPTPTQRCQTIIQNPCDRDQTWFEMSKEPTFALQSLSLMNLNHTRSIGISIHKLSWFDMQNNSKNQNKNRTEQALALQSLNAAVFYHSYPRFLDIVKYFKCESVMIHICFRFTKM